MFDIVFFINSLGLGVALAMDAFSVSIANGLNEPSMSKKKAVLISSVYAFFQFAMPMIGWFLIHSLVQVFSVLEKFIPFISLSILSLIGVNMILDCIEEKQSKSENSAKTQPYKKLAFSTLIIQGIATSIDALSVGLTIEKYALGEALVASLIIAVVTFVLCIIGIILGKKIGNKFSFAGIVGGVILIAIGLEIFLTNIL